MPEMSQCAVIVLFFISVLESIRGMPEVVEALSEKEPFPNTAPPILQPSYNLYRWQLEAPTPDA